MNMDGQKQTYEQFKADILQWKDAHREATVMVRR